MPPSKAHDQASQKTRPARGHRTGAACGTGGEISHSALLIGTIARISA
jgi:hypothetical protein